MKKSQKHRGRIQAQGGGIEESESWASEKPPSSDEGLKMLKNLREKLSKKEQENRKELFDKAERFIEAAGKKGGVTAKATKKFQKKYSKDVRIDIEVIAGLAFVSLLLLFIVYKLM